MRWWSKRNASHFTPHIYQKYIYMWNNSHRKLPGKKQNSHTTKAVSKVPTNKIGWGKKSIRLIDICPPGRGLTKKERPQDSLLP